ncbi:ZPR1 zinc finger domain-containing protein [Candidatus Woesearchaeota archaeon]|nr:ZPR1 zinc finger domain-containing protein [Candidatus Woesearchaeota archaeon]
MDAENQEIKQDDLSMEITDQECPVCHENSLTMKEEVRDINGFGIAHFLSMSCTKCGYYKSDIEADEERKPFKETIKIENENDLDIKIIKSADATIKFQRISEIIPTDSSNGYITTVKGLLNAEKKKLEELKEGEEDDAERKKIKNKIKKIGRILWGRDSLQITIEDPTGNSVILRK